MGMVRTQVQLTKEQLRELKDLARQRDVSVAELVREGVNMLLRSRLEPSREELWERAPRLIGAFHSGIPDLGVNHDKYLWEDDQ